MLIDSLHCMDVMEKCVLQVQEVGTRYNFARVLERKLLETKGVEFETDR